MTEHVGLIQQPRRRGNGSHSYDGYTQDNHGSFDKTVFLQNMSRGEFRQGNEYQVIFANQNSYVLSLSEAPASLDALSQLADARDATALFDGQSSVVRALSKAAISLGDIRGWSKAFLAGRMKPEFPLTLLRSYSGRVDVLDDSIFLVTIKNDFGEPVQLSFPLAMARDADLTDGDFISYRIVRKNGRQDHEFRKEHVPELSQQEIDDIDALVDGIFD